MELQELSLQHLFSRLEYAEPCGPVLDRRGATAAAMRDYLDLLDVTIHPTAVEIDSDDKRDHYRIGIAQTYVSLMNVEGFADAQERTAGFFEMAMGHLGHPSLAAINLRTYDIAPASSFEELRDLLCDRLAVGASAGLSRAVGTSISDLSWVFEFKAREDATQIQFGAMESKQLASLLNYDEDSQADYPANMFFVGVTMAVTPEHPPTQGAIDWWRQVVERNRAMVAGIGTWIKGVVA